MGLNKAENFKAKAFIKQAKAGGAEISTEKDVTLADSGSKPELRNPEVLENMATGQKGLIAEVFSNDLQAESYIFFINKVTPPTEEAIKATKETEAQQYNEESGTLLYQALVDALKSQAEIEIAGNLRDTL